MCHRSAQVLRSVARMSSAANMFSAELTFRTVKFDEAAIRSRPRRLLHVDASHGPTSVCAHGASAFLAEFGRLRPDLEVEHLHLWEEGTRGRIEYNLEHVRSKMAALAGTAGDADVERFAKIEELALQAASAWGLLISAPMWNYGVPHVLKQYFDCILHPGLTFRETSSGPKGLLGDGRPLVIVTSAGGTAAKDHLTPWVIDVASMMGFDASTVVSAKSVAHGDRQAALDRIASDAEASARYVHSLASSTAIGEVAEGDEDGVDPEWSCEEVLAWLRQKGGISEDGLESLEAMKVDGSLWHQASKDDWQSEELGLEDGDVDRLVELQSQMHHRAVAEAE
eukprot:gnl/TRDRNA2_/TRDRNA2_142107_c1_seq1.p1 gnl/TRDRNA2_/TRDRNA2_142107_c1~~gnl/TRDRNA2_/TRDRNA2_142107_c1_seq1.p1  ORF type:complete len:339 (-),score=71.03 gnl/TRDRNA2_/TRDRNA2_142107_c1_seq1:99-1115(-)